MASLNTACLAILLTSAGSAQIPAPNWDQQKCEILRHYRDLVQLDTRASDETPAVGYLRKLLED